jgi:hypothetical protein
MIEWEWDTPSADDRSMLKRAGIAVVLLAFALFVWYRTTASVGALAVGMVVGATVFVLDEHVSVPSLSPLYADRSRSVKFALLFGFLFVLDQFDPYRRIADSLGASEAQVDGFMVGILTAMAIVLLIYEAYAWQSGRVSPA